MEEKKEMFSFLFLPHFFHFKSVEQWNVVAEVARMGGGGGGRGITVSRDNTKIYFFQTFRKVHI
jgi:hypothetical protein